MKIAKEREKKKAEKTIKLKGAGIDFDVRRTTAQRQHENGDWDDE